MASSYARLACYARDICPHPLPCLPRLSPLPARPAPPRLPCLPRLSPLPAELTEKRKTYTFFLLTDDVAAANSSGGPKTLMYRVRE